MRTQSRVVTGGDAGTGWMVLAGLCVASIRLAKRVSNPNFSVGLFAPGAEGSALVICFFSVHRERGFPIEVVAPDFALFPVACQGTPKMF